VRIAVFAGSQLGPESHHRAAASFATDLARAGVGIVYGGGAVGLMGVVADAALAAAHGPGHPRPDPGWHRGRLGTGCPCD
jgi:predicted Rossmann-fold nucleotide-binding protein